MIQLKNIGTFYEITIHPIDEKLKKLVEWVASRFDKVLITTGYEKRNYSSVHSTIPLRGIDLRAWIYDDPILVCYQINENWIYDHKRPYKVCAKYHKNRGGEGYHIHLQVHENTTCKEPYKFTKGRLIT